MTKNQFWKGSTFFVLFSFDLTLLRLVLGGEQNRVWELRTLANGEFMWRQFPPTHRPLLALHHLLCRNLSRSDLAGKTHVLN